MFRIGFVAGLSFLFLYNSARIVLQIYLSKSLRNKEKNHTNVRDRTKKKRKIAPITNDDLDKTHVMTVKEAKKKPDQGNFSCPNSMKNATIYTEILTL